MNQKNSWRWIRNPLGHIDEHHLQDGFVYKLTVLLGPNAHLRIHDGQGKAVQSFQSYAPVNQMIVHRFTFDDEWNGCLAFSGLGDISDIKLEIVGVSKDFK